MNNGRENVPEIHKCYTLHTFCNLLSLLLILWKMASELNEHSDRNLFLQEHGY